MREDFSLEEKKKTLVNQCNVTDVRPAIVGLPYPPIQVEGKNRNYAELLAIDYCGQASEMTSIMQYINHENKISLQKCPIAKTILGIAMAEMIHLQKLGEFICLLGGSLDFTAMSFNGRKMMWNPSYVKMFEDSRQMIRADIEGEMAAINQYRKHITMIKDDNINAVLFRIIKDEEYHIMLLKALLEN